MDYKKDDQMIYVRDLLFVALYQWRRILAAAVAMAVILGGLMGLRARLNAFDEDTTVALEIYEEEKQLLEQNLQNAAKDIARHEEYLEKSVLLTLDPYAVQSASAMFSIHMDYPEQSSESAQYPDYDHAVLHAYKATLANNNIFESVAATLNMEAKYLSELVTYVTDAEARVLEISVRHSSADDAEQILDLIVTQLKQKNTEISQGIYPHELRLVTSSVSECVDLSLQDSQEAAQARLEELRTIEADAQSALDLLTPTVAAPSSVAKTIVIYAILGGVLGAFLMACVAWVGHLSSTKVYSGRTMQNRTGVKLLGCMPVPSKQNAIDRWLKKKEGRSVSQEQAAIIAATVRNYCTGKRLLITGDCDLQSQELVLAALKNINVDAVARGSLLCSTEALSELPTCDAVLLVEKCGCSRYSNILQTANRISDQGKPLLGCVLLNG